MSDSTDGPGPSERGLAVVTGASTGIGRAFAEILAREGFDLVIAADETYILEVGAELAASSGRRVVPLHVDLSGGPGVEHLHDQASAQGVPVTVAVLNAGMGVHGRFDEVDLERQLQLIDLNVRSTVHLATLLTRDMVLREEGRLLFVSSIAGKGPGPGHAAYAASKAFVHSFAEATRHELAGTGVSVTSLLPGPTDTAFFERAGMQDTVVARGPKDDPYDVAREGYDAMMAGRDQVVAGSARKALGATTAAGESSAPLGV
ncbi:SDR family NAD(P)-dependent oxidoreductase [Nocardioides sediminis]|uniref:SDR family NAD(P)-dependent oxidoreductase n=1 Tax=Nocardioides sediminis TaxID=433648 RepID=UPI00131F3C2D|nr:SDR family NAD(P)-dependent oxidoreductase [Nocardioides sediminis]